MKSCDCDITKFYEEICHLQNKIFVLGHTPRNLIESIFAAFGQVQEPNFVAYITPLRHKYSQGKLDDSYATILDDPEALYCTLKAKNEWDQPTPTAQAVLALKAEFNHFKKNNQKGKTDSNSSVKNKSPQGTASSNQFETSKTNKKKKKGSNQKQQSGSEWKAVPPKANESKVKHKDDKTYHWCTNHQAWTIHKPGRLQGLDTRSPTRQFF
jgi:hypothetical protein